MLRRLWWLLPVIAGGGFLLWLTLDGIGPGKNRIGAVSNPETTVERSTTPVSDSTGESIEHATVRESPRHSTGEIEQHRAEEKNRLAHLKQAVRDQEDKVEERRKLLATIVRAFYGGTGDAVQAKEELVSYAQLEKIKHDLDSSQDYLDAKRNFETDQKLLQEMKLKLITVQIETQDTGK